MRKGVLALVAAILVAGAAHAEPIGRAAFRDAVIAAVRKQAPGTPIHVTGEETFVAGQGPKEVNAYTGNLYLEYAEDPSQFQATVAKAARVLMLAAEPARYAAADLRVAVRPRAYVKAGLNGELKAMTRPIVGDLLAIVAIDTPEAVSFPPADDLQNQLKLADSALWARALANTRVHMPKRLDALKTNAVNLITLDDGYAASVLADDDLWRDADKRYPEGLVVAAPERNTVLVLRRHAANDVDVVRTLVKAAANSPQALTDLVLVRQGGRWVVAP